MGMPRGRARAPATTSGPSAASRRAAVARATTTSGLTRSRARRRDLAAVVDALTFPVKDAAGLPHFKTQVELGLSFQDGPKASMQTLLQTNN